MAFCCLLTQHVRDLLNSRLLYKGLDCRYMPQIYFNQLKPATSKLSFYFYVFNMAGNHQLHIFKNINDSCYLADPILGCMKGQYFRGYVPSSGTEVCRCFPQLHLICLSFRSIWKLQNSTSHTAVVCSLCENHTCCTCADGLILESGTGLTYIRYI